MRINSSLPRRLILINDKFVTLCLLIIWRREILSQITEFSTTISALRSILLIKSFEFDSTAITRFEFLLAYIDIYHISTHIVELLIYHTFAYVTYNTYTYNKSDIMSSTNNIWTLIWCKLSIFCITHKTHYIDNMKYILYIANNTCVISNCVKNYKQMFVDKIECCWKKSLKRINVVKVWSLTGETILLKSNIVVKVWREYIFLVKTYILTWNIC